MAVLVITILLVSAAVIFAVSSNFTVPYTFTSGTTISASQMNANFQALGQALPVYKTVSTGATPINLGGGVSNTISITVTPPSDGFLTLFARVPYTRTSAPSAPFDMIIYQTDSAGNYMAGPFNSTPFIETTGVATLSYPQGSVTANTPLYFACNYAFFNQNATGTVQGGELTAVFIPATNQLP